METPADIPEYVAPNTNLWIVIFLKHFDPFTESLRGVSHLYMRKNDKVGEVIAPINEKMGWPKGTEVSLFEEIKPTMIEPIKPKQSFHQAEIQDGDIICFQKALSDKETEELKEKKMPKDPKEFYDFLVNLTAVHFIPKIQSDHKGFTLSLSKKNTYDEVAEKVGAYLGVPGTHLRFMTVNSATGTARTPIKYGGSGKSLQQIFTGHYYQTSVSHNQLLYEVLDMPLAELETKRLIKFVWLPEGISKEEHVEALVPKNGTVADAVPYIQKRYNIDDSAAEKIRFFAAHAGKFHKDIPHVFNVAGIQEFMLLYAEIVPDEEHMANPEESRLIEAFHFQKEPSKPHTQGVPFQFLMKKVCVLDTPLVLDFR
jgi:ubiquitin carboxyl-terminal hydrolase 7